MTRPQYAEVSIDQLTVDPAHQRSLNPRAECLTTPFNPARLGALSLSRRPNGVFHVMDGQHRVEAARRAGYAGPFHALVESGLTGPEESSTFLDLNSMTRVSAIDKFRQRVRAARVGDPAPEAGAIVQSFGLTIANAPGRCLAAVGMVDQIMSSAVGTRPASDGPYGWVLSAAIDALTGAWGLDQTSVSGHLLAGISALVSRNNGKLDREALIRHLQSFTPASLLGQAKSLRDLRGGTISASVAYLVTEAYNKRKRTNRAVDWAWLR